MQLTEISFDNGQPVDGYGPNFFRIAGKVFEGKVALLPQSCGPWLGFDDPAPFVDVAKDLDVLLVGMGANITHIPAGFLAALEEADIGVEIMNSPTACRTYNVLLSEGRRIGLALLPV
jgi:uncharacterized protein|tara:strand:- start:848 stop:1201 length:354 start_codon:yes stop_codon:yes gene_type:complete